jgi:hypothetical protein
MPHDRSALINQLRELLTEKRHDSVVIHNYCRSARHIFWHTGRGRRPPWDTAKPENVSSYLASVAEETTRSCGSIASVSFW